MSPSIPLAATCGQGHPLTVVSPDSNCSSSSETIFLMVRCACGQWGQHLPDGAWIAYVQFLPPSMA